MENEKITVIVPVYNVEEYLDRCVKSIMNQTYRNLEIILVDDGATDQSGAMCDEYASQDTRIKVIHKKNGGLSSARNAALDIATGAFIGFVDSDDYIHPTMFEKLYDACLRNQAQISICCHYTERGDKLLIEDYIIDEEEYFTAQEALKVLVRDKGMKNYAWDKLYKAELFAGVRYPDGRNYEDIATTYLLFHKADKLCRIPEYLYYYQIRENSISGNQSDEKWHKNCYQIIVSQKERYEYFLEKEEKELADICLAEMVPYLYDFIHLGIRLHTTENRAAATDFLKQKEAEILANPFLLSKDKKLIKIYTSPKVVIKGYSATKQSVKLLQKAGGKAAGLLKMCGVAGSKKYDFSLNPGKEIRLILFELPCFDNLGDHAIAYAQKEFLKDIAEKDPKYQLYVIDGWDTPDAVYQLKKEIGDKDIIFCQGGGNLGNLYPFADAFRIKIMRHFSNHQIIVFPQTIYFTDDDAGRMAKKECQKVYNQCKKLTICARDSYSYKLLKETFEAEIIEVNDIVSYLDRTEAAAEQREGILLCLRSDGESALTTADKKRLQSLCESLTDKLMISDTCMGREITSEERDMVLQKKWQLFGKHQLVVTDRLHGMIFSIITGTPCVVLGNNHHKVKATFETFQGCQYICYAGDVEKAMELVRDQFGSEEKTDRYRPQDTFFKLENMI